MTSSSGLTVGHVEARVHGRYLLRRAEAPAPLLIAFHGYGEAADSILDSVLETPGVDGWHVASVQALNRFYNRRTREVVAGWMTKQDRKLAIADNVAYVEAAVGAIVETVDLDGPIVYAGFSQGTAMTYRAAAAAGSRIAGIIALAGDVPPEIADEAGWSRPPVLIGCGTEDDWYGEARASADRDLLSGLGSEVELEVFDGGHVWTDAFRRAAGAFLARLR